jgi:hypothetical protein
MDSPQWWRLREAWLAEWRRRYGVNPVCVVCGGPWRLHGDDLHHMSYARLGHERFEDLWPFDRDCHEALHRVWDASPGWRALGRERATAGIVALLRRRMPPGARCCG